MNALDIIKYGHNDVLESITGIDASLINKPGVTTRWSIRDTLAHLVSYEHLLEDALHFVAKPGTNTPYLDAMNKSRATYNDDQVSKLESKNFQELLEEYNQTYERVRELVSTLGPKKLSEVGTIPWYGNEYSLDDFIVYASYGHKREHVGQIHLFQKRNISES